MVSCLLLDLLLVFLPPWPCLLPLYCGARGFSVTSVGGKPVLNGSKGPWGHTLGCGAIADSTEPEVTSHPCQGRVAPAHAPVYASLVHPQGSFPRADDLCRCP